MKKLRGRFRLARAIRRKNLPEKEQDVQFSRQDQLTMAGLGHGLILAGVSVILWKGFEKWPGGLSLLLFYVMEAVIVVCGILATISTRQLVSVIDRTVLDMNQPTAWMNSHPTLKVRVQAGVLLLVFALQFGSLAALLVATSGPIESPFAPMALAIGIFTPFIVNRWRTVALIIFTTMAFYVIIIMIVGFGGHSSEPEPGSYAAVNLFILLLASVMTFKRRESLSFTLNGIVEAPPERVWRAWTDADQVADWLGGKQKDEPKVFMNPSKGGSWQVTLNREDGRFDAPWSGRYLEVEPPKRLVFTIDAQSGIGEEIITLDLKERGEGTTEIVLTQIDNGRLDGLKKGWSGFMRKVRRYVMTHDDVRPEHGADS